MPVPSCYQDTSSTSFPRALLTILALPRIPGTALAPISPPFPLPLGTSPSLSSAGESRGWGASVSLVVGMQIGTRPGTDRHGIPFQCPCRIPNSGHGSACARRRRARSSSIPSLERQSRFALHGPKGALRLPWRRAAAEVGINLGRRSPRRPEGACNALFFRLQQVFSYPFATPRRESVTTLLLLSSLASLRV